MPGMLLPQGFALAIPSAWTTLPPDSHSCCLTSFRSLFKCHFLREALPDYPHKTALLPSQALQSDMTLYMDLFSVFSSSPHEIGGSLKRNLSVSSEGLSFLLGAQPGTR